MALAPIAIVSMIDGVSIDIKAFLMLKES